MTEFSPTLTFADDPTYWDLLETCVFGERLAGGDYASHAVGRAKHRAPTWREQSASGGVYTSQDVVWLIPVSEIPTGRHVRVGDRISDANGEHWTVLEAVLATWRTFWRCTTRNLALAYGLTDSIEIQSPVTQLDAEGTQQKTWIVRYTGVKAKIQPISQTIVEQRGLVGWLGTHVIFLPTQLTVGSHDRVIFERKILEVKAYRNAERIDELPVLDVELVP